jgi:hypothetical protein
MARKIFVSYKYGDVAVQRLPHVGLLVMPTARNYVDYLHAHLDLNDHIIKGENDGEDLSGFKEDTIASRLRDKIYDSTITVVLVSKGMKDLYLSESDQWIPWEISYSLKEHSREGRTSGTNAVVAVILPDEHGSYAHFIQENSCASCGSTTLRTDTLFEILRSNMFNRKTPNLLACGNHGLIGVHSGSDHSYIYPVKWHDFMGDINGYLDYAYSLNDNIDDFNIIKVV